MKSNVVSSCGHGSTGPGEAVNHTGGEASLAQLSVAWAKSPGKVFPMLAVWTTYPIPSLPAQSNKAFDLINVQPPEPRSSSFQPASFGLTGTSKGTVAPVFGSNTC